MTSQNLVPYRRKPKEPELPEESLDALDLVASPEQAEMLARLAPTIAAAEEDRKFLRAERTLKAYDLEWKTFVKWATAMGLRAMPATPAGCVLYVTHLAGAVGRKPRGIGVALAAIGWKHREARYPSPHRHPVVLEQLESVRRKYGVRPDKKLPATVEVLRPVIAPLGDTLADRRDKAILLLGFAGAYRRSELVSLDVRDLTFDPLGLRVLLRKSKTDQTGEGYEKAILYAVDPTLCPVGAVRALLDAADISDGPIFRRLDNARRLGASQRLSGHAVAVIVKARLEAAGIDPKGYSGHSLRAGLVTSAAKAHRDVWEIARQTGHKSMDILMGYVREAQLFENNAGRGLL